MLYVHRSAKNDCRDWVVLQATKLEEVTMIKIKGKCSKKLTH